MSKGVMPMASLIKDAYYKRWSIDRTLGSLCERGYCVSYEDIAKYFDYFKEEDKMKVGQLYKEIVVVKFDVNSQYGSKTEYSYRALNGLKVGDKVIASTMYGPSLARVVDIKPSGWSSPAGVILGKVDLKAMENDVYTALNEINQREQEMAYKTKQARIKELTMKLDSFEINYTKKRQEATDLYQVIKDLKRELDRL